jgi:hypothetical protein
MNAPVAGGAWAKPSVVFTFNQVETSQVPPLKRGAWGDRGFRFSVRNSSHSTGIGIT